jgi:hypothetical protein
MNLTHDLNVANLNKLGACWQWQKNSMFKPPPTSLLHLICFLFLFFFYFPLFFLSFFSPSFLCLYFPSSPSFFMLLHASKKMTTMGSAFACHSYFKVATIVACPPHEDDHKEVGSATCQGPLAQLLAT